MNNPLTSLGLGPLAPQPTAVAVPVTTALRTKPAGYLHVYRPRPSDSLDPEKRQRAGSLIEGMAAAAFTLDYTVRQISYLGVAKKEAKRQIGVTLAHVEKLTKALMTDFQAHDVDYFNTISGDLQKCIEYFCALDEGQKEAALRHMQGMKQANLAYLPPLTPYTES